MRTLIALAILLATTAHASAQTKVLEPGPKLPEDSLKCIQVRPGFTVELMAAEPLVMDPIAFAWGPDGKFWVVEMGDYPLGVDGKNKFGGKVKFLEKLRDNDGPYTKATTFLDNLGYPTGVTPWGKGVIITCAPDIFYAEDIDGDGKADRKIILFTGFREGNQQHRVNGLVWGLDNWLYGANGDSGGIVKAVNAIKRRADGSHVPTPPHTKGESMTPPFTKGGPGGVNISGRDFRLKPDTGEFEAVTGQTQFGRCRDDWGNWFGNNNSNPMFHFVLEDRYLKRNPHILYPDPRVNVSVTPGASKVYPISKPLPRFNSPNAVNHFTSACSTIIYRDNLLGPEFYGNSFVSEPVHNLIHREVMKPKGVTFTSQRAADEQTSEFLASSDNWFRPAMIATGPDGALWIADMYRFVIEHPEWIPLDWQKKVDLRAGHDMGRIYRVYPKDKTPRAIARLDKLDSKELVKTLESPNGWVRDTAQALLVRQLNPDDVPMFRPELVNLAKDKSKPAASRIHAIYTLSVKRRRDFLDTRLALLNDENGDVRRHAIESNEEAIDLDDPLLPSAEAKKRVLDDNAHVRMQLAYGLGFEPGGEVYLATLLQKDPDNRFLAAAVLSSVNQRSWPAFFAAMNIQSPMSDNTLTSLLKLAAVYGKPRDSALLLAAQINSKKGKDVSEQMMHLATLLDTLEQTQTSIRELAKESKKSDILEHVASVFGVARDVAANAKAPLGDKMLAIRLLGRGFDNADKDRRLLGSFLSPQFPEDIQVAAVQRLGGIFDPLVPDQLIAPWKSFSPPLRAKAMDVMLSRIEWTRLAVEALERKRILPSEIDTIRRQKLLDHRDAEIRKTAAKIFATASDPDRAKLIDVYWVTLPQKGNAAQGLKLFEKHCAACHQVAGIGQQVGPDFAAIGDKSPQGLLSAILDPNRAVEARYVNYLASTKAGLTVSGLLQSETSTTITLVAADGKKHELLRNEIDELTSTGKSAMPEGFEKDLSPAAMADLLAFLRGNLAKPKPFAGNRPETVKVGADGSLRLLATNAAIFGKTLVYEEKHKNLGYWSSPDDQAAWTIDVPKEGRYDVWLDYACEGGGDSFHLQIGAAKLTHKVANTASWDLYRRVKIGMLRIAAGRHDAVMQAAGPIRTALIDVREIQLTPAQD